MPGNLPDISNSVIAAWPIPNYDDPTIRPWMAEYASILKAFTAVFVVTRLWLRVTKKAGAFGLDDVRSLSPDSRVQVLIRPGFPPRGILGRDNVHGSCDIGLRQVRQRQTYLGCGTGQNRVR